MSEFILASASSARRRLLQSIGINPRICVSNFDEAQIKLTDPIALVEKLAQSKAEVVLPQVSEGLVLGCDSILVIDREIHGKPQDAEAAFARWQKMRDNCGILYTGHALIERAQFPSGEAKRSRRVVRTGITRVYFGRPTDAQIRAYIATGEPLVCAGAFALEGKGSVFIDKIEGCHSNVIGLSLPLLRSMLAELDCDVTSFWRSSQLADSSSPT